MAQYGFTKDEKHFYACAHNLFMGDSYVLIYSVPDFKIIKPDTDFEIFDHKDNFFFNLTCELDEADNTLNITTTCYHDDDLADCKKTIIYKYNFNTGDYTKEETN